MSARWHRRWVTGGWVKRWRWGVRRWEGVFVLELIFLILPPLLIQDFLFLLQERKINENSNINGAARVCLRLAYFQLISGLFINFCFNFFWQRFTTLKAVFNNTKKVWKCVNVRVWVALAWCDSVQSVCMCTDRIWIKENDEYGLREMSHLTSNCWV